MNNNTIDISNDEINVEEIMEKIREKIRVRQAAGELPSNPDSLSGSSSKIFYSDNTIPGDISYISTNWDIHNNSYFISSHHPYIGRFLVKGRQMVLGEVRRYVDPVIARQAEFNASCARIITRTSQQCTELNQGQQELGTAFSSLKRESDKKIADSFTTIENELDVRIESIIKELFSRMDVDIHSRAWLAHMLETRVQTVLAQKSAPPSSVSRESTNYFLFEERFRGSREEIKQRQLAFLPYFEKCSRVLDIGCGRGEFLEILRDNDIRGTGVDSDPDMVEYCHSRHLDVETSDAIDYLETLEDKSLDGIFIDQVVEHLEPDYLVRLLGLCYRKMKFGYYIVVETVNPLSFVSFVNFYIDLTHKRPVHPETLQYLISASGFRECEKKFLAAVAVQNKLKKIEETVDMEVSEKKSVETYNQNIEILNGILFGAQDYVVIGKK